MNLSPHCRLWCAFIGLLTLSWANAVPTAEEMQAFLKSRPEMDEIQWKDESRGAPFTVRLLDSSLQGLVVEKRLASGLTQRKLPLSDIGAIHITLTPEEIALLENPEAAAAPALGILWNSRKAIITLPGANVAETGVAFAKALRASNTAESLAVAGDVLTTIMLKVEDDHWKSIAQFQLEVLEFARAKIEGDFQKTDELAWKITENAFGENSDAMLIATAWLADRHFIQLKAIEEENPRWEEDLDVKPTRDRLYHLALDFALYPSLFEGGSPSAAAAGLAKAARVYQFTEDRQQLKNVLEDLIALYPESSEAKENSELLEELEQAEASGRLSEIKSTSEADQDDESENPDTLPTDPPAAKRYSIFGD